MFMLRAEDAVTPTSTDGTNLNKCVEGRTVVYRLLLNTNSMHRSVSSHNFHAFNNTNMVIPESCHSSQTGVCQVLQAKQVHMNMLGRAVRLVGRVEAVEEDLSLVANSVMVSEGKEPNTVLGMGTAWT